MKQRRIALITSLSALVMIVFTNPLRAQNLIGIKGGVTLASADVEDLEGTFDSQNRTGWAAGGFLTLGNGLFVLQPELNIVELGFEASELLEGPEVKLKYLSPAVLLKLGVPLVLVRPNVFGGVGWGFELDCKIGETDCDDVPLGFETKSTDPTAIFGADVDLSLGSTSLRADARYLIGLSDISEASDVWTEVKNRAWIVSVGLAFHF